MNVAGRGNKKRLILFFLILILVSSCSSRKVLVLTDPYWNDFSSFCGSSVVNSRLIFFKEGLIPVYETYQGDNSGFSDWLKKSLQDSRASSMVMTHPYIRFEKSLAEFALPKSVMRLNGTPGNLNYSYAVSSRREALKAAGTLLGKLEDEKGSSPVVIIYKNETTFSDEYSAILEGWGREAGIIEKNTLFIEPGMNDVDGHILSFFNRYDFENRAYSVLAIADPFLPNLMDLWPENGSVTGILTSPELNLLPDNIDYLIFPDISALLEAAAGQSRGEKKDEILYVESKLIKR